MSQQPVEIPAQRLPQISAVVYAEIPVVRVGLMQVLRGIAQISEVDGAASWAATVAAAASGAPGLVLIDSGSGEDDKLLPRLRQFARTQPTNVLLYSARLDPGYIRSVFAAGARGLIHHDASEEELRAAAVYVGRGHSYLHPTLGASLLNGGTTEQPYWLGLSDRECEVVRLVAVGHTQREIANLLHISVRTVETHLMHVRNKLHLSTRADVVRFAFNHRLVPTS
jgi:two-component system response regulator NreC